MKNLIAFNANINKKDNNGKKKKHYIMYVNMKKRTIKCLVEQHGSNINEKGSL